MKTLLSLCLALTLGACTFHSTATHWNGRLGPNGEPVYVKSSTNVGFNLGIVLPLLGSTEIDAMVSDLTGEIAAEQGDTVRIIESSSENYWYGFPPFTWIFTPVITTVTADYEPSAATMAANEAADAAEAADG